MTKEEYREYLGSKTWRRKRDRVLRRDKHTCQTCGVKAAHLEVHHRTYERVGRERMGDLLTLCSACHAAISGSIRARGVNQHWPTGVGSVVNTLLGRLRLLW